MNATCRALTRNAQGAAMVEALIAFVPLFVLFLGCVQWALLAGAKLVVDHAAQVGARCAAVVLPDDPRHYDGAELGSLTEGVRKPGALRAALADLAPVLERRGKRDGARMADVRSCVHARMTALVPSDATARVLLGSAEHESVASALGEDGFSRLLHAPAYVAATTAVTFPTAPGSPDLHRERVPMEGEVVVRVSALWPCLVPLVSMWMCPSFRGRLDELGLDRDDPKRIALHDLRLAPLASLQHLLALRGAPMAVLSAEARMPLQIASYAYAKAEEPAS